MSPSGIIVTPKDPHSPYATLAKAHHVGDPPTGFKNPWPSAEDDHTFREILATRFGSERNFVPVPQGPNGSRSEELVAIRNPDFGQDRPDKLRATWIGHASVLVEFPVVKGANRGFHILFDPVFSDRTSPSSWFGPKRYSPTPCTIDELPEVDLVCTSHNHYDHLDHDTVKKLYLKSQGRIHFFVALGIKSWFQQHVNCQEDEVTELDWWQRCSVEVPEVGSVELTCTPAQHFSRRTPFDGGQTLWCSWAVEGAGKKFYFSGDTGYQAAKAPSPCPAFKKIGDTLGPFDLAFLPIGLYSPPSFMGSVHATPEQSLCIHKDIKSKLSIGMHYGTVRGGLSGQYEDVREPPKRWRQAALEVDAWRGGGIAGDGDQVDCTNEGVGLCHIGETVGV